MVGFFENYFEKIFSGPSDQVCPLLAAIRNNSVELTKILIEYTNDKNIVLNINEKDKDGLYPLHWAIYNNNFEITHLLIEYANDKNIILTLSNIYK